MHWLRQQLNPVDLRAHLACLVVLWLCVPTYGTPSWSAMLAGELSKAGTGHGIARLAYDHSGLPLGGHLQLEYNTDTVRLDISQLRWGETGIEWGVLVAGQWRYAGLLPDYYRKDRRLPARGFHASAAHATVRARANLPAHHAIEFHLGLRRWLFSRTADTDASLQLPPDASILEARVWHTYWRIAPDTDTPAQQAPHPRVRGFALTTQLGLDIRSRSRAWGARDPLHFDPVDRSNNPGANILLVRQWLRAGRQVSSQHRIQLQAVLSWGRGEDDLTRLRIGGMTPYVVPVGGLPWPAHLGERVAGTTVSLHRRVATSHEAGMFVDAVSLVDSRRTAEAQRLDRFGGGIFLDGPWRERHVDTRLGWSPPSGGQPQQISIFVALGQSWD